MRWTLALAVSLGMHAAWWAAAGWQSGAEPQAASAATPASGESFALDLNAAEPAPESSPSTAVPAQPMAPAAAAQPAHTEPSVAAAAAPLTEPRDPVGPSAAHAAPPRVASTAHPPASSAQPAVAASPAASNGAQAGGTYGAAGDRSAQDLATAFVRAFPQAASTDGAWTNAALGSCGTPVLTFELSELGAITAHSVQGATTPALQAGIERTLLLLRHRTFTAKGQQTRIELTCQIQTDDVHDGLHGDVFALGASFAGNVGGGFFALATGRRIDVRARLR